MRSSVAPVCSTPKSHPLGFALILDSWRGSACARGLARLATGDVPGAALAWAADADPYERSELIGTAMVVVASADLEKAVSIVSQMEDGVLRDAATASLTRAWAATDPKAAIKWAAELSPGPARNRSLEQTVAAWAKRDITAAAAWVKEAPESTIPVSAYCQIMSHLEEDISLGYTWLNGLPENAAAHAIKTMYTFPGESDVSAVLALPGGEYKELLLNRASTRFFQMRPDQALAWALSLPDPEQRQQVRQTVEGIETAEHTSFWNQITNQRKAELLQRLE